MTTSMYFIWQVLANIADEDYPLGFIYDSFTERLLLFMQTVIVLTADGRNGTAVRLCKQLSQLYYL